MSSFAPVSKRSRQEDDDFSWPEDREFFAGERKGLHVAIKVMKPLMVGVFAGIPRIQFKPDAPPNDVLCFRHYNAQEVILYACVVSNYSLYFGGCTIFFMHALLIFLGCARKDNGGVAAILRLLLAHFPWYRWVWSYLQPCPELHHMSIPVNLIRCRPLWISHAGPTLG